MDLEPKAKGKAAASKNAKSGKGAAGEGKDAATSSSLGGGDATSSTTGKRRSLAIEEKYQKMTQREHIIKRPDTYSGIVRVPSYM